jgi:hypothetical protein
MGKVAPEGRGRRSVIAMTFARAIRSSSLFLLVTSAGCSSSSPPPPGGGVTSSCAQDDTVACAGGTGYSCTGSDSPDDSDSTLICSSPVDGNAGSELYCCADAFPSTSSCAEDPTVTGCPPPSIGFSCTSTDTPMDADPSLTCGPPADGNAGSTLYCCQ